jgi:hypothetical protein
VSIMKINHELDFALLWSSLHYWLVFRMVFALPSSVSEYFFFVFCSLFEYSAYLLVKL